MVSTPLHKVKAARKLTYVKRFRVSNSDRSLRAQTKKYRKYLKQQDALQNEEDVRDQQHDENHAARMKEDAARMKKLLTARRRKERIEINKNLKKAEKARLANFQRITETNKSNGTMPHLN